MIDIKLNPRVTWQRSGFIGRVSIYWEHTTLLERARLTKAVVLRVGDEWTSYSDVRCEVLIKKPHSSNLGGAALREEITNRVRNVRDVAKAVLRGAGLKGVR